MVKKLSGQKHRIDIKEIFLGLQDQMRAKLTLNKRILTHPVTKGDASELEWIDMLSSYLPKRYQVEKAYVIDCQGNVSDQIDIVICDRQYSPFILRQNGATYVPAESVYAVIEVKPKLSKQTFLYAAKKAASVRKLKRTTAPIAHAGGVYDPKEPASIFAGLIALDGTCSKHLELYLKGLAEERFLNFGCSLEQEAFWFRRNNGKEMIFEKSKKGEALLFFVLNLMSELQRIGTVSAMDLQEYMKNIKG